MGIAAKILKCIGLNQKKDVITWILNWKNNWKKHEKSLKIWGSLFDFADREAQIAELEVKVAEPDFWDKPEEAQQIMQKITALRSKIDRFN